MPTVSEPTLPYLTDKASLLRQYYLQGLIGEPTYRLSLQILGWRGQALDAEVNLATMEKADAVVWRFTNHKAVSKDQNPQA